MPSSPRANPSNVYGHPTWEAATQRHGAGQRRIPFDSPPSPAALAGDTWAHAEYDKFETGDYDLLELQARRQLIALRGRWSWWLIAWISFLLVSEVVIAFFIGLRVMDFEKHSTFLSLLVGQNFLQIVGMGYLIVKFLYPPRTAA